MYVWARFDINLAQQTQQGEQKANKTRQVKSNLATKKATTTTKRRKANKKSNANKQTKSKQQLPSKTNKQQK